MDEQCSHINLAHALLDISECCSDIQRLCVCMRAALYTHLTPLHANIFSANIVNPSIDDVSLKCSQKYKPGAMFYYLGVVTNVQVCSIIHAFIASTKSGVVDKND